mgnify:CR=1 FL=1
MLVTSFVNGNEKEQMKTKKKTDCCCKTQNTPNRNQSKLLRETRLARQTDRQTDRRNALQPCHS